MSEFELLSSFEEYLAIEEFSSELRAEAHRERDEILSRFPYAVMLQVDFHEFDFVNRWCWQQFGPCDGECLDRESTCRVCDLTAPHSHTGTWLWHWWVKTGYDFGFNEWYFAEQSHYDLFLRFIPEIR